MLEKCRELESVGNYDVHFSEPQIMPKKVPNEEKPCQLKS